MKIRRLGAAALALALASLLTSCGSSSSGNENSRESAAQVLSASQVDEAVIATADLGPGFKVDTSKDEDGKTNFGCLENLDKLDKLDKGRLKPVRDKEIDYAAASEIGVPGVFSTVGTFSDEALVTQAVRTFKKALDGCTSVDATDDEGFHVKLTVSVDDKTSGPGATAQVNLRATGTGQTEGITVPFGIRMTVIQVKNNLSLSALVSFGDDVSEEGEKIAAISLERLVAVVAGRTPAPRPANLHVTTEQELLSGIGGEMGTQS